MPEKLPEAYEKALLEMRRRNEFNSYMYYLCSKMNSMTQEEKTKRQRFNNKYGVYLPKNLVPKLIDHLPDFTYVLPSNFKVDEAKSFIQRNYESVSDNLSRTFSDLKLSLTLRRSQLFEKTTDILMP